MQFLEKVPRVPYDELRQRFQPGDCVFYGPLPFQAVHDPASLGGYLSNQGIRAVQWVGNGHLGWHNAIHVEQLLEMSIGGQSRWLLAGFTNKRNAKGGGLDINAASWRMLYYAGAALYVPIREEYRAGLTNERMLQLIELYAGDPYGAENLFFAESRIWVGEFSRRPFCSSWAFGNLVSCQVIPHVEWAFDGHDIGKVKTNPPNYSPKDMVTCFRHIWDWERAAVVVRT